MDGQKTAQEVANDALGEIGQNMLDQTGGDVWRSGQPLNSEPRQVPPAETPAAESTSAEATQEAEAEPKPTSEPEQKLVLGKYKTEEDALRGYHEAVAMGNAAKAEADALKVQLQRLAGGETQKESQEVDPLEELESFGVPKELMRRVIGSAVNQGVEAKIQEMFAPSIQKIQADKEIIGKYPEYQERFDDLTKFVSENKDVEQAVLDAEKAGQYGLAREYAWLRFTSSNVQRVETQLKEAGKQRETEIKAVRKDAAVSTPVRTDGRTKPTDDRLSENEYEKLKELAKAGHPSPLWRETIGRTLPKDFDNLFGG